MGTNMLNVILGRLSTHQPELHPSGAWDAPLDQSIENATLQELTGDHSERTFSKAFKSGLHLWNDSLAKSHTISQSIENKTGSYWHGIMHRMEADYSNAKYWFRSVGTHPIFEPLVQYCSRYLNENVDISQSARHDLRSGLHQLASLNEWNPSIFIDLVELQVNEAKDAYAEAVLRKIQWLETALLLRYCYHQSCGGTIFDSIE